MIAPAETSSPSLEALSPEDGLRLAALSEHARSPFKLAAASSTPIHEILNWLARPDIQEHIDRINALEDNEHRAAAIQILRTIVDQTEDHIEKRRAACAILRALSRRNSYGPGPLSLRSAADRARAHESADDAPDDSSEDTPDVASNEASVNVPSPAPAPPGYTPSPPTDLSLLDKPSPDLTLTEALTKQLIALRNLDQHFFGSSALTIRNFATPDFPIQRHDRNAYITTFSTRYGSQIGGFREFQIESIEYDPTGYNATAVVALINYGNIAHYFTFHLTRARDGPAKDCWLTDDINEIKSRR